MITGNVIEQVTFVTEPEITLLFLNLCSIKLQYVIVT